MKKSNLIILFIFFLAFNFTQAQDEEKEFKFKLIGYGTIGNGIVQNYNEPNYNLNSNSGEILLNYNFTKKFEIATGIGMNELSGNGFNSTGNFYHERTLLKVPLLFTMNSKLSENFTLSTSLGFYGQNIIKDEYQFLTFSQKDVFDGWNFGAQIGLSFMFEISDDFSVGINYNGQSDLSDFEKNNNFGLKNTPISGIADKQKMKNLNSLGIIFKLKL